MTDEERRILIDLLDAEWRRLEAQELRDNPNRIQYAAAIWQLLELLPLFLAAVAITALLKLPAQLLILHIEKAKWER